MAAKFNRASMVYRSAAGFSLVELMVAMTLGLIILLAVSELFVGNSKTRSEMEKTSRQLENGRYAIQLLIDDISNAGFFGEAGRQDFPASMPPVCATAPAELEKTFGVPLVGGDEEPDCVNEMKGGTDFIAIRRASTCRIGQANCDTGPYHLQVPACLSDLANPAGDIILKTSASNFEGQDYTCTGAARPAPVYRYISRIYYVNDSNVLVRAELGSSGYTNLGLVEGIEQLAFEYGLDTTGNGAADSFVEASAAAWDQVVAVRVWIIARSLEGSSGYSNTNTYTLAGRDFTPSTPDNFRRQVYSTTVRVNNLAGRRE